MFLIGRKETRRWLLSFNQRIAIRNVLTYLVGCLQHEETGDRTFDTGGPDLIAYHDLPDI